MPGELLQNILLYGERHDGLPPDFIKLFDRVIGEGKEKLPEKLPVEAQNLAKFATVNIFAHGGVTAKGHYMDNGPTRV